jgi:hypothetical protein
MHKKSPKNYWMSGRLHNVEGDMALRRINKRDLIMSIYNIYCVVVDSADSNHHQRDDKDQT